jgi:hypothetical protein
VERKWFYLGVGFGATVALTVTHLLQRASTPQAARTLASFHHLVVRSVSVSPKSGQITLILDIDPLEDNDDEEVETQTTYWLVIGVDHDYYERFAKLQGSNWVGFKLHAIELREPGVLCDQGSEESYYLEPVTSFT